MMQPAMESRLTHAQAILLLLTTAVLWSFGGLLIKWVSWHPMAIAGMRSLIAAPLFLLLVRRGHLSWSLPQIGGAVCYAVTVILFVQANKLTTAANAIMLQYTAPLYVAVLSAWLLRERVGMRQWLAVGIAFAGMGLFFLDKLSASGVRGNLCAIASGVAFAGVALCLRRQRDGFPLGSLLLGNLLTALAGLPFMFERAPDTQGWIGLILLGTLQLGASYVLYGIAIRRVMALEAIMVPVIEPVLNPIWVFLLLGEVPGHYAMIGGSIVLASVVFTCLGSSERVGKGAEG